MATRMSPWGELDDSGDGNDALLMSRHVDPRRYGTDMSYLMSVLLNKGWAPEYDPATGALRNQPAAAPEPVAFTPPPPAVAPDIPPPAPPPPAPPAGPPGPLGPAISAGGPIAQPGAGVTTGELLGGSILNPPAYWVGNPARSGRGTGAGPGSLTTTK